MRAAFYECDITPPLGGYMWGHYSDCSASDVYDRLYAKAAVIENDGKYIAIIAVDTCVIPPDMHDIVTKRIFEYTGIEADCVLISSNHTHTGAPIFDDPSVYRTKDETYTDVFYRLSADAVTLAYKRLEECTIEFGTATLNGISFNRNFILNNGTIETLYSDNENIVGTLAGVDPVLSVLSFNGKNGKLGAISSFACHQACVYSADGYSGDYSSTVAKKLKDIYGNDFVNVFLIGTCGDINNIDIKRRGGMPDDWFRDMGKIIANGVGEAISNSVCIDGKIDAVKKIVEIPRRKVTYSQAKESVNNIINSNVVAPIMKARNLLCYQAQKTEEYSKLYFQAIRIGDVCISALPGEVYVNIGIAIKQALPFKYSFVVENCNSYCGYVPTKEAFSPNSNLYEIQLCGHSCLDENAEDIYKEVAKELADFLKKD